MNTILMNMCMVHDLSNNSVLVLDKFKKEGWEGLTFPGGHVERMESLDESCKREIKEETNLEIDELTLKGIIQWYKVELDERHVGLLYYTNKFTGDLVKNNVEGNLKWIELKEFLKMENKSDSMDDIMKIYMGEFKEIIYYFKNDDLENVDYLQ